MARNKLCGRTLVEAPRSPTGEAEDGQNQNPVDFTKQGEAKIGGGYRDRTGDPLLAKQVLSQLS